MYMRRKSVLMALVGGAVLTQGCASRLPTHPWQGHDDALRKIVDRAARIETVSARCRLLLTRPGGNTVQLDGALAARVPGYLRLRAWKLSQPIYDVTATPQGTWVYTAPREGPEGDGELGLLPSSRLIDAWEKLAAGIVDPTWDPLPDDGGPVVYVAQGAGTDEIAATCSIDRSTQTVRECDMAGGGEDAATTLRLDRYRSIDGHVWPTRVELVSSSGTVIILFDDVALNTEIPAKAFTPPRRAAKQE